MNKNVLKLIFGYLILYGLVLIFLALFDTGPKNNLLNLNINNPNFLKEYKL